MPQELVTNSDRATQQQRGGKIQQRLVEPVLERCVAGGLFGDLIGRRLAGLVRGRSDRLPGSAGRVGPFHRPDPPPNEEAEA